MKRPPSLPDLNALTEAQKDELIVGLWKALVAIEGSDEATWSAGAASDQTPQNSAPPPSTGELRERIRRAAPSRRAQARADVPARLGRRFEFLGSKALRVALIVIGLGFLADFGVSWNQQRILAARDKTALELKNAAFAGLYVELLRIAYEPDGKSYRATLNMQNANPDAPLYVMLNPVRVFEQTGMTWQETPSQAPSGPGGSVVKLDGAREYSVVFQADVKDWAELIPGYMHVRIQSDMLISQSSEPKDDIVERNNRFYVYLKPQGSDDAEIKRRSKFSGAPPIFIPMPPH
ncbi:hypothetical protein [Methylocapsa aurea]|uniref:hypothetical protein n=1 Tax=Methylocapsa aurea TaxID=663610 RepID=UPI00055C045F|nr:hypothetical protein [Methylocapsa aurea]